MHDLTLCDALGKRLRYQRLNATGPAEIQLHLEDFRPGMYLLVLQTSTGPVLKRISLL